MTLEARHEVPRAAALRGESVRTSALLRVAEQRPARLPPKCESGVAIVTPRTHAEGRWPMS